MAVDPNKYSIYATRDAEKSNLNWGKVASDVSTTLSVIQADRQARKDKLDEATNTAIEHLSQVSDVKNSTASALLINGSDMSKKNLMIQTDMLKRGLITPKDYMLFLQEQKSGYTNLSTAVQNWDKWYQDAEKDLELDKNGNIIASEGQIYGNETLAAFGNLNNKQLWTNPNNGQLQLVEMGKDQFGNYTVMPDPDKNPEKFLNPNSMNVRMTFKEKRKVLNLEAEKQVSQIASFIESGVYDGIITNTTSFRDAFDDLEMGKDEAGDRLTYDKWLDMQVESLTATPNDIMQILMEYKRGYHIAQTEEEFKEKYCKEVKPPKKCDTSKMIQARYEDGRLVYDKIIGTEQEKEAKRLARIAVEVQIGREIKKSGGSIKDRDPDKGTNENIGSYFGDLKNIIGGNEGSFNASERDLMDRANQRLAEDKSNTEGERITNIKREKNFIEITYTDKNNRKRTKIIERYEKGDDDAYTDIKVDNNLIYQQLNTALRPNDYSQHSYEDLRKRAEKGGFKYEYQDYRGDETRESRKTYKEKKHTLFSKQLTATIVEGKQVVNNYPDTFKEKLKDKNSIYYQGGSYNKNLTALKNIMSDELSTALDQENINMSPSDFIITGKNLGGLSGANEFTITVTNPFDGSIIRRQFTYTDATNSTQNVLSAMDEVMLNIIGSSNISKGKKQDTEEDGDDAPIN